MNAKQSTNDQPVASAIETSPWHFLSPLDSGRLEDRQIISLTRERELDVITDMVSASRVSILYAYSGNGKTSLINAGLIPQLQRRGYLVFSTRPRPPEAPTDPLVAFKTAIMNGIQESASTLAMARIRNELRKLQTSTGGQDALEAALEILDSRGSDLVDDSEIVMRLQEAMQQPIPEFLRSVGSELGISQPMLIICDQFEELFVHYSNTCELHEFVQQLGDIWADHSLDVRLLFSMREDWVGSMIEFRTAIPEIFANYYKLGPLTRDKARDVLTKPLEDRGITYESAVIEQILRDLVHSYRTGQQDSYSDIKYTRPLHHEEYIELPALQVVADAMWQTRDEQEIPFSLTHYQSLVPNDAAASPLPAEWILEHYLNDILNSLPKIDGILVDDLKDMRLDCLYLLTDRVRHRRALSEPVLHEEVQRIQPSSSAASEVSVNLLRTVLQQLSFRRLVVERETGTANMQYELAHDFAVRSVVRWWRELDRRRTAQKAVRKERVKFLEASEGRTRWFLRIAGISALLFVVANLVGLKYGPEVQITLLSTLTWANLSVFAVILVVGLLNHRVWNLALGAGGVIGLAIVLVYINATVRGGVDLIGPPNPAVGSKMYGSLTPSGDIDFYYIDVRESSLVITASISGPNSEDGPPRLALFGGDGYTYLRASDSGEMRLSQGAYYVGVSCNLTSCVDYELTFAPAAAPTRSASVEWEREPNNWHGIVSGSNGNRVGAPQIPETPVMLALFGTALFALMTILGSEGLFQALRRQRT